MNQLATQFSKGLYIAHLPPPPGVTKNYSDGDQFEYEEINIFTGRDDEIKITCNGTYVPTAKDKLYFFQGCNVPRYKVREWGKKHDISITSKADKATAKFIPRKGITDLIKNTWMGRVSRPDMLEFIINNYDIKSGTGQEMFDLISNSNVNYIYLNYVYTHYRQWFSSANSQQRNQNPGKTIEDLGGKAITEHYNNSTNSNLTALSSLDSTQNLYLEEEIIELSNEDAAVLDKNMFDQLSLMFDSDDKKSWVMALSIMTDCNIQKSLHWVLLLLVEYSNTIKILKERNHVNFKSLLKYIDKPNWDYLRHDDIIDVLMDKEALTHNILRETALEVKEILGQSYNTKHFKIKTVEVSDEVKDYFTPQKKENLIPENLESK